MEPLHQCALIGPLAACPGDATGGAWTAALVVLLLLGVAAALWYWLRRRMGQA